MTDRQRVQIAFLAAAAFFMENLDATIIVTALPAMSRSFARAPIDLNIAVLAYTLAVGVSLPVGGWLSARFGSRRVFLSALVLFTVASAMCGLSRSLEEFVLSRILQGVGGAMMIPVSRLAVFKGAPKSDFIRLMAILTWPGLLAPVIGPPLGGLISTVTSWRWIFYLNLPLGMLALLAAWLLLPRQVDAEPRPFDWAGALLFGLASASLMVGVERLGMSGAGLATTATCIAVSVGTGWAALRHLNRTSDPLFRLTALRHRSFLTNATSGSVFRIVLNALPFMLPLLLQLNMGLNAFEAGSLLMVIFIGNLGMKPFTTRLLRRFGFRRVLLVNGAAIAAVVLACASFSPSAPLALVVPVLFVSGLCRSMQFTSFNTVAFADIEPDEMNDANTLNSVIVQITASLGVAAGSCLLHLSALLLSAEASALVSFRCAFAALALIAACECIRVARLPRDIGRILGTA